MKRRYLSMSFAVVALPALAATTAGHAAAQDEAPAASGQEAEEYTACLTLAARAPEQALESAAAWKAQAGGAPAEHCAAAALYGLGRYAEAAGRLEKLAQELRTGNRAFAGRALRQAGRAWMAADEPERAKTALTAALELTPDDVEALIDRAWVHGIAQDYWDAIDDLNRAQDMAPERVDLFVFRGTAYRFVGSLELAQDDIETALRLEPNNADALLERGILYRLQGDDAKARAAWLKVVALAAGTPVGDVATANLEKLDGQTPP